jgi:hypothetical protein
MNDFDDFDETNHVSGDFYSLVGQAQLSELEQVEKQREAEREAQKRLAEEQQSSAMTLMQIAGMRTRKEIEQLTREKDVKDDERLANEDKKRKEAERERLSNQFPPPDL